MLFKADIVGKLVDTFLADHGGIHICEKKLFAAIGGRLQHHVNIVGEFAQTFAKCALVSGFFPAKGISVAFRPSWCRTPGPAKKLPACSTNEESSMPEFLIRVAT